MSRSRIAVALLAPGGVATGPKPLNVVSILADDLGWTDIHSSGTTFHDTPKLKRLAARALRFTNDSAEGLTRFKGEYITVAETFVQFGKRHLGRGVGYEPKDQEFDFDVPHTPNAAGLINDLLKQTEAVVPKLNPGYRPPAHKLTAGAN